MHGRHDSISKPLFDIEAQSPTATICSPTTPPTPRSPSPTLADRPVPTHRRFASHLRSNIHPSSVALPSIYLCFLTGLTASPSFAACFIWCGFQTGNAAQLGLAVARIWAPHGQRTFGFRKMDQQALVSLICFFMGAVVGQVGNVVGGRRRAWLSGATLGQMVLMAAGALAAHYSGETGLANERGDPSWATPIGMTALAFLSATMGLQGAVGCKLGTPLGTTVPLTSTWIDIFNDPFLFALRRVHTRDTRIIGAFALIFGAMVSRFLLSEIGSAPTIAVVIGFRAVLLVWWHLLPGEDEPEGCPFGDGGQDRGRIERVEDK
ncbi:hypothetical protein IAT38_001403 [Cryptococcus sp. DSM 104549]